MTDKIQKAENTIAVKKQLINNIEKMIENVNSSITDNIRVKIETKHFYGYSEPFIGKCKNKLYLDKETLISILESAIDKEKKYIDKCIDIIIEERKKTND